MCSKQLLLTPGRTSRGRCKLGHVHVFPFTKGISPMEEKRKPIIRQPCAISTVSKLCSPENRQVTKPGTPTCTSATASLRGPDERAHASRPFQGPNPAFQGGELRRRTRRRPGARLGSCGCGPSRPPPARPLSGRRSAPHRDRGLRDPVLRPARPPAPEHPETALRSACG